MSSRKCRLSMVLVLHLTSCKHFFWKSRHMGRSEKLASGKSLEYLGE